MGDPKHVLTETLELIAVASAQRTFVDEARKGLAKARLALAKAYALSPAQGPGLISRPLPKSRQPWPVSGFGDK